MLVHEHVNRSRDAQEDRYGTTGCDENDEPSRHTIPVVEGDARLNGW